MGPEGRLAVGFIENDFLWLLGEPPQGAIFFSQYAPIIGVDDLQGNHLKPTSKENLSEFSDLFVAWSILFVYICTRRVLGPLVVCKVCAELVCS